MPLCLAEVNVFEQCIVNLNVTMHGEILEKAIKPKLNNWKLFYHLKGILSFVNSSF